MDTSNVKIKVLEKPLSNEDMEDVVKNAAKKQRDLLTEKYKKFKNKGSKE